jgi:DUSP domain
VCHSAEGVDGMNEAMEVEIDAANDLARRKEQARAVLARKERVLELGQKYKQLYDKYDTGSVRYTDKYVIQKEWLKRFKEYVRYKDIKRYSFERSVYLAKLTVEHLDTTHPGPISNEKLLKDPASYVRVDDPSDTSNYVIRKRFKETVDFKLMPQAVWDMLFAEFGGVPLRREKDQSHFSYFSPKYRVYHEGFKILILPPWNQMDHASLQARKALKIYYNSTDTMMSLKTKIAAYLSTPERPLKADDVRLWKPDFHH